MTDSIKDLEAKLAAAKKQAEVAAYEAGKAIPQIFAWEVKWQSQHRVHVSKKLSAETEALTAAWRRDNPSLPTPSHLVPQFVNGGMTYVVINNYLVSGGGLHVLRMNKEPELRDDPVLMTDEEVNALRAGEVLESLKYGC